MVIKYKFLTGEKIEIEVSNRFGETMLQIDNEIKNSNRRETRRHQSLNELNDKADLITGESIDIGKDIL